MIEKIPSINITQLNDLYVFIDHLGFYYMDFRKNAIANLFFCVDYYMFLCFAE